MKITAVRAITVRYPEPHDHNRPRLLTLVRIATDSGQVGWGEAITMFIGACRATEAVVQEDFAPLLLGQGRWMSPACMTACGGTSGGMARRASRRWR